MSASRFRNDIQGLRALAVGAVVLNHALPQAAPGGYVGVDVFFVISGFLISRIIAADIENERFSIVDFYRKRVRRIFPALLVVLLATLAAGYFMLTPAAYRELAMTAMAASFFVSNFAFYSLTGYFDGAAEFKPLLHLWSLAVEEQFYIFFPPFLMLFWRRISRAKSVMLLVAAGMASLLVAELLLLKAPSAAYYMLPPRAVELLIGVLIGIGGIPPLKSQALRDWTSVLGLAMMIASITVFSPTTPFPGVRSLLPCLGAGLLIHAGTGGAETWGGRLLSLTPLTYIGAISYSLYLWHWPILVYLRTALDADLPIAWAGAAILAALALASLTYHLVERPVLSRRADRFRFLWIGGAQIALVTALCGFVMIAQGIPGRYSPEARKLIAGSEDINPRRDTCHYGGEAPPPPYGRTCAFGSEDRAPDVAVWGDSHGAELAPYLGERAGSMRRSVRELTSSACPPAQGFASPEHTHCGEFNEMALTSLAADAQIRTVILVANGQIYKNREQLERGMQKSVEGLLAAGKSVIVVMQTPLMAFDVASKAALMTRYGLDANGLGESSSHAYAEARAYDRFVSGLGRQPGVAVYDPKRALCDKAVCHAYSRASGVLYFNPRHLSLAGVGVAFRLLADKLYAGAQHRPAPVVNSSRPAAMDSAPDLGPVLPPKG